MKYFKKEAEKYVNPEISKYKGPSIGGVAGLISAVPALAYGMKTKKLRAPIIAGSIEQIGVGASLGGIISSNKRNKQILSSDISKKEKAKKMNENNKRKDMYTTSLFAALLFPVLATSIKKPVSKIPVSKIIKKYENPAFESATYGLNKFGEKLTKILEKLPTTFNKAKIGADPEIIGIKAGKIFKKRISSSFVENVNNIPRATLDLTARGIELNPVASSKPIKVVESLKDIIANIKKSPGNKNFKLTNLANFEDNFKKSVAGGHIHLDIPEGQFSNNVLRRGAAGTLFTHYIVPGAAQRAGAIVNKKSISSSYGKKILDTRGKERLHRLGNDSIEIRHLPTWAGSEELAKGTLETAKLTAHNPETFELTDKFIEGILADTGGLTKNLYNQKVHKKVMNYLERLYTKVGVSGDKTIDYIFNEAAKAKPKVNLDIYKNWGIK